MTIAPVQGNVTPLRPVRTPERAAARLAVINPDVALANENDIRHAVALHAASTVLPAFTPLNRRNEARIRWFNALKVVTDVAGHPQWALAYVPGYHHNDNDTYAVHLPSSAVFGSDCAIAGQQWGEDTDRWLTRLTGDLDVLLVGYRPEYVHYDDLA